MGYFILGMATMFAGLCTYGLISINRNTKRAKQAEQEPEQQQTITIVHMYVEADDEEKAVTNKAAINAIGSPDTN